MKKTIAIIAVAAGAVLPAVAADGDELAVTSADFSFDVNLAAASPFAFADFSGMPVTWRKGESVSRVSPNGDVTAYVADASSVGTGALGTLSGGVWTLDNDGVATVKVAVPWSVYGDGEEFAVNGSPSEAFAVDTEDAGPNRKWHKSDPVIPVAYSGDDWSGDLSTAARLTFTPPDGSDLAATVRTPDAGEGTTSFTFSEAGIWTVLLEFEDGTSRTAYINVTRAGLIFSVY